MTAVRARPHDSKRARAGLRAARVHRRGRRRDEAERQGAEAVQRRLAHAERHPDGSPAVALNLGFEHATGEILSAVGSDALLLPGTLPYVAHYFERHPEVDVVYGHRVMVDEGDNEVGRWVLPRHDDDVLAWAHYVPADSVFWRRRVWEASGGEVDEELHEAMDWELLLRFREVGARMERVPGSSAPSAYTTSAR